MKTGFLITARLKSSRLPLKLLLKLQGREVVRHVIDRAKQVAGVDSIVLCTSTDSQDHPLAEIAAEEGILYYPGDGTDVLKRLSDAAKYFRIDNFLSVTADNPLFCVYHANRLSNLIRMNPATDYAYLTGLPIGAALYALRTRAVDVVCKIKEEADTEIWGPFINRPEFFNVASLDAQEGWACDARLTLDEPCDFEFISQLTNCIPGKVSDLDLPSISRILKEKPELRSINSNIIQRALAPDFMQKIDSVFVNKKEEILELVRASR